MATPEERIAAGQELRKRGKLSSQQDAALSELERRYGSSATPEVGRIQLDADGIPLPSRGTVRRSDIVPVDQTTRSVKGIGTIAFPKFVQDMFPSDEQDALDQWRKKTAYELAPGKGSIETTRTTPEDVENLAQKRWEQSGRKAPKKDVSQVAAGLIGAADIATLGFSDEFAALKPAEQALMAGKGFNEAGKAFSQAREDYKALQADSVQQRPVSTRVGQTVALAAPGGKIYSGVTKIAPKLVAPAVAARFAGQSLAAQGARYTGRLGALGLAGATEFYGYNALAEAPNQAREAGAALPSVGERLDYANSQILSPAGLLSAGIPIAGSAIARGIRAPLAATKNVFTTGTARPALTAGRPTLPAAAGQSAKAPLTNLFTPSNVQRNVAAITPTTPSKRGRTAREEAIDLLLAKGLKADETEKLVRQISYDNYTNVDEMLFELANADVDQLAVAAARVGGEAKKTFREAFKTRAAEMPERIRTQLRDAMALSGDDLETFAAQMTARADDATADGYKAAYAQQVSDDTWAKMWDRLSVSPDTADAIAAGARLAKNSYRGNPAQLEVARQLDELAGALRSSDVTPPKLSTHALDYLDRGFGSLIAGQKKNNPAFASSLIEIQKAIRSAGLDADTGLDVPRGVYSQYKAASRGIDFGAKAFGRGTPLRDIKKQFSASLKDADEVFEDIVGEGRSVVDQALVMGWLRGAEDAIETATNPGALIRQIYGSERQRAKLMEMMPQETDVMTSGVKGDQTKRIKALVGSALGAEDYKFGFTLGSGVRAEGRAAVPSLFERQRTMLENQGRVSGNSVTGEVTEAIANQGGLQRAADLTARALMNPQDAARNAMLWAVQKVTTPAIFKPEVNRELGRILTTRGRDELLAVVAELRARQAATARRPSTPPAGGAPPVPPAGGSASGRTVGKGKLGTRTSGIVGSGDLTNAAFGAGLGGIAPAESPEERARNMAIGAGIGIAGGSRTVGKALGVKGDDVARTAGAPRTPQQAARFETPGSPEYEAAVAKGLDMSQAGRMGRAKEMGFDTDKVYYRGSGSSETESRGGVWVAEDSSYANSFATGKNANVMKLFVRGKFAPPEMSLSPEAAARAGFDGRRAADGTLQIFDPSNIRSVNAAFDPDKAASPILTAGAGGGRKPPKPDSPEAIRESVRKVSESIRAKGINAKPQPSEMRVGKGMSKLTGIKDDPAMSMNVASDMLKAGRSPDEIWTATQRLPIKIEGRTILVRGAGKTPEDVQAGFWQEMAKPYSKRASWAQKGTEGIFPMGSGSIARQPLDDRLNAVAKRLSTNRERIPRRDIWEETGVVVITRGQDGQMVTGKAYITNGFEPVALMDAKQFKTFDEAQAYLDSIPAMPRADQPDWYRKNFSQVLDAGSLRRLGKGEVAARRVGEQVLKHPRVVGFAAGSAIGASGVIVTDAELKRRQAATRQPTSTTKMLPTPAAQNNRANISR
jgi:hypothetical protein